METQVSGSKVDPWGPKNDYNVTVHEPIQMPAIVQMGFPKVNFRFFPLRADIDTLQKVCNRSLNFTGSADRPPFFFKPAAPFVLMQLIHYNRLTLPNTWLSQNELIFSIPIEWYDIKTDGRNEQFTFRDWAMTSPFIYLDHPISIWIGREVFGWPKLHICVRGHTKFGDNLHSHSPVGDPTKPQLSVAFDYVAASSQSNPDRPQASVPLVELYQDPHHIPWLPTRASDLFAALPRAVAGSLEAASSIFQSLAGMRFPNPARPRGLDTAQETSRRLFTYLSEWLPEFWTRIMPDETQGHQKFTQSPFIRNQISLKQFRDAQDITSACFQAIVHSGAIINRVNDAGLLFDPLSADPSGRFSIRLYDVDSQPIVKELGLTGERKHDPRNKTDFTELKPLFPFWWNLDLVYSGVGPDAPQNLCTRAKRTFWSADDSKPGKKQATPQPNYVEIMPGVSQAIPGPFDFDAVEISVLPFRANRRDTSDAEGKLKMLLDNLLNNPKEGGRGLYHFSLPKTQDNYNYVCLLASQFQGMTARGGNQRWSDTELTFAVPAIIEKIDTGGNLVAPRPVLVPVLGFVGGGWNAITDREIYGRLSLESTFSTEPRLMGHLQPGQVQGSLCLNTYLAQDFDRVEDERIELRRLLELRSEHPATPTPPVGPVDPQWLRDLSFQPDSQITSLKFDSVALKQFRDAREADKACYQALVQVSRTFNNLTVSWLRQNINLDINYFKTADLAGMFGFMDKRGDSYVPVNPFHISAKMSGSGADATNLAYRIWGNDWYDDSDWPYPA